MFPGRGIWDQNKVIQQNAFCLYRENFLAFLLYSTDPEHRDKAVTLILAIRDKGNVEITPVRVPEISFDAETWDQLVYAESFLTDSHSPPCLKTYMITLPCYLFVFVFYHHITNMIDLYCFVI